MTVQVGYDFAMTSGGDGASETTPLTKQGQERHLGRTAQNSTNKERRTTYGTTVYASGRSR